VKKWFAVSNITAPAFLSTKIIFANEDKVQDVIQLIRKWGGTHEHPQGFSHYRVQAPNEFLVLYEVRIWDNFVIYAYLAKAGVP
jgi:hypothetical protein